MKNDSSYSYREKVSKEMSKYGFVFDFNKPIIDNRFDFANHLKLKGQDKKAEEQIKHIKKMYDWREKIEEIRVLFNESKEVRLLDTKFRKDRNKLFDKFLAKYK